MLNWTGFRAAELNIISSLITVNVMISRYCFAEDDREYKCVMQVQNTCFSSFYIWKL